MGTQFSAVNQAVTKTLVGDIMKSSENEKAIESASQSASSKRIDRKKLLVTVFSSLQGLEKCVESSKKMMVRDLTHSKELAESLREQTSIINKMRRAANKLQLQIAAENWNEATRSLQIFYGLRKMVRPEIMSTFQALANKNSAIPCKKNDASIH